MLWLKHLPGLVTVALVVTACGQPPAQPAPQQAREPDPAAYRGAAVAAQVCVRCHDVGQGAAPEMNIGAPTFRDVANKTQLTGEGLAAWMRASHPQMPNYIFSGTEVDDLAAYVLSLRDAGRS